MQKTYNDLLEDFISAPIRSIEWRVFKNNRIVMEDSFLDFLQQKRRHYLKNREYQRVQRLTSLLFLFEASIKSDPEHVFFGRSLLDEERALLAGPLNSNVFSVVSELDRLGWSGKWSRIIEELGELLDGRSAVQDTILRTELYRRLASACKNSPENRIIDNLESALEYLELALQQRGNGIFPVERARVLECMGGVLLVLDLETGRSSFPNQVQCYKEALEIFTPGFYPEGWASLTMNLGTTYFHRTHGSRVDNIEQAISNYRSAGKVFRKSSFPFVRAILDLNLGNAYLKRLRGDPADNQETALGYYRSSLRRRPADLNPLKHAFLLNNMVGVYRSRIRGVRSENIESGIDCCDTVIEICERNGYSYEYQRATSGKGYLLLHRVEGDRGKNIEEAVYYLKNTEKAWTFDSYPSGWANLNEGLAEAYIYRIRGTVKENRGLCLVHCKAAKRIFKRTANPSRWAWISYLEGMANLKAGSKLKNRGLLVEAESRFEEAIQVLSPVSLSRRCIDATLGLLKTRLELGDWEGSVKAAATGKKAGRLKLFEATSVPGRASEFEGNAELYFLAAIAELRGGKPIQALNWLEEGRLKEVNIALSRDRAVFRKGLRPKDKKEYSTLLEQLRLVEWKQRTARSVEEFKEASGESLRFSGKIEIVARRIQEYIPDFLEERVMDPDALNKLITGSDAAYFVFIVTEFGTGIILLAQKQSSPEIQVFFKESCTKEYLETLASRWRASIDRLCSSGFSPPLQARNAWRNDLETLGRELYRPLFTEAFDWVRENCSPETELVFVPHLSLHQVPLHLSRFDTDDGPRYLAEERCFSYRPGLSLFDLEGNAEDPGSPVKHSGIADSIENALVISDPSGKLVWSEAEADSVAALIPGKVELLKGSKATLAAVRRHARDANLLHFACHARFDSAAPWNSSLLLANVDEAGTDETGNSAAPAENSAGSGDLDEYRIVPLSEIFALMECRKAELVVLGACDSGRVGANGDADEFEGLAGGFLGVGAKNVVASMWPVDDRITAVFMTSFYRNLFENRLTVSESLCRARLELCATRRWSNPYFWGAFVVYGF